MKKMIAWMLLLCFTFSLLGCSVSSEKEPTPPITTPAATTPAATTTGEPKPSASLSSGNVMRYSGRLSDEGQKQMIAQYESGYTPFVIDGSEELAELLISLDFTPKSAYLAYLAPVDENDRSVELSRYLDVMLDPTAVGTALHQPIDWWYRGEASWANQYPVWSYTISVKNQSDKYEYYYFRVDYSAVADQLEPQKHDSVLSMGTAEDITDGMRLNAIADYSAAYQPIVAVDREIDATVSFEVDYEIADCGSVFLANAAQGPDVELRSYLDCFPDTRANGNVIDVMISWWYETPHEGWSSLWSYTVWVEDTSGAFHFYYFRVDYSALQTE